MVFTHASATSTDVCNTNEWAPDAAGASNGFKVSKALGLLGICQTLLPNTYPTRMAKMALTGCRLTCVAASMPAKHWSESDKDGIG